MSVTENRKTFTCVYFHSHLENFKSPRISSPDSFNNVDKRKSPSIEIFNHVLKQNKGLYMLFLCMMLTSTLPILFRWFFKFSLHPKCIKGIQTNRPSLRVSNLVGLR